MTNKHKTQIPTPSLDLLFGTDDPEEKVCEIRLDNLFPYRRNPYQVRDDNEMEKLVQSVKEYGVLAPGIARVKRDGGYEIISGHRRRLACEKAGLATMPMLIKKLTDDQAAILVVDSNIQRDNLLYSEKAFAYKLKLEALRHQGKRTDLTSHQFGEKSDKKYSVDVIAEESQDSSNQILRYIRLTELISDLLNMVDHNEIAFNAAVELSYICKEEQMTVYLYLKEKNVKPTIVQAKRIRELSIKKHFNINKLDEIFLLSEKKTGITLSCRTIKEYFPADYSEKQIQEIILKLLDDWKNSKSG